MMWICRFFVVALVAPFVLSATVGAAEIEIVSITCKVTESATVDDKVYFLVADDNASMYDSLELSNKQGKPMKKGETWKLNKKFTTQANSLMAITVWDQDGTLENTKPLLMAMVKAIKAVPGKNPTVESSKALVAALVEVLVAAKDGDDCVLNHTFPIGQEVGEYTVTGKGGWRVAGSNYEYDLVYKVVKK